MVTTLEVMYEKERAQLNYRFHFNRVAFSFGQLSLSISRRSKTCCIVLCGYKHERSSSVFPQGHRQMALFTRLGLYIDFDCTT